MRLKIFLISVKVLKYKSFFFPQLPMQAMRQKGLVEEDLTDDDSTKDPIFMPRRHDIDSDDSNPPENIMPTNDTDQSNNDVSELFKTPPRPSKEAKEVDGSRTIHSIQALADHIHSKRLDTRQSVYGDGDCFF